MEINELIFIVNCQVDGIIVEAEGLIEVLI